MEPVVKLAILILATFLAGFAIGRRLGIKQGFHVAMAYAVLDIRRRCLEQGHCLICSFTGDIKGKDSTDGANSKQWGLVVTTDKPHVEVLPDEFEPLWLQDVTL